MTKEEAFKILSHYQSWRRYDGPIGDGPEMQNPTELGKAIDVAIEVLSQLSLPSNLDKAAIERMREPDMYLSDATIEEIGDALLKMAHFGAEWMAEQYEKIEGEPVDWYGTSDGKDYCCGIKTVDSFEVPEGFYIRKKQ